MNPSLHASPVSLSYVAALRGVKPRKPGEVFTYADLDCKDASLLICLAASNPEGKFFGILADKAACVQAAEYAALRGVDNVSFVGASINDVPGLLGTSLPPLNYLVCDESHKPLKAIERATLFAFAEKALLPGGLFNYVYQAYDRDDGALRFLVRELGPEMNVPQAKELMGELKALGSRFFAKNPQTLAKLNDADAKNIPDEFLMAFDDGVSRSGAFETLVALGPRGFAYAGDAVISANYLELTVPVEAQEVIMKCNKSPLYETIKDFALDRTVRSDIWCHQPIPQSADMAELFGNFIYGVTMEPEKIPQEINALGKTISLASPLYTNLIDLLTLIPAGVGDFLAHPKGEGFAALEVVGAIQILIACGIVQPMRGVYQTDNVTNIATPKLVGGFNQYLDKMPVNGREMLVASPVVGNAISITAKDALVIQALSRAGLANSVSALFPELQRLAQNPAEAALIMDTTEPTAEMAKQMIEDVVNKSIVQWYAYGVLEAA